MTSPEHAATVDALEMIVRGRGSPVPGRLLISPSELNTLLDAARKAKAAEAERDRLAAQVKELEAALQDIASDARMSRTMMVARARAALNKEKT